MPKRTSRSKSVRRNPSRAAEAAAIVAAQAKYHEDGSIEIDSNAEVSMSGGGAYVQAWVYVSREEMEEYL
jgi:hypothetical protein